MTTTQFTWHTIEHMLRNEFGVDDDTYKGIAKDIWNAAAEHFGLLPQCTRTAPTIGGQNQTGIQCVLPQGHQGWHSDGTQPRPMRWTP